ncbi:hypothetical protein BST65_08360 [Bradyrhizobium canariense]|nr:hypothetical protein BST65_08360 [Bradyrhizobium canariense]OSI32847.1 hypothetical protein BST66_14830 [Bradyrhizobium canariense]OSI43654.1 hypothetical protein BSZ20_16140 [Bradyrhizobium canariense]OSI52221.1 hypothetical protein BST67_10925 [Bradyrhizobium canariense]OSI54552.1 hypothetical protein BSZ15_22125 [Bradyrhizobium canariense]
MKTLTQIGLRTVVRVAWLAIGRAKGLAAAGERLEAWAERAASTTGNRMEDVLWPLQQAHGERG